MFVMTYNWFDDDANLVAIDDVSFEDCDSQNPPPVFVSCDFESDYCSWSQNTNDDQADWERTKEGIWYENTGPGYDHTTGTGYYVYFSSHNHQSGDLAILSTPEITKTEEPVSCFSFWFHIYGEDFDTIRLNINKNGARTTLWTISSTQGNLWKTASVDVPSGSENYKVKYNNELFS